MDSKELCLKLGWDQRTLMAAIAAGLPRRKEQRRWVYDEVEVARWVRAEARKHQPAPATNGELEVVANTVPECLRAMAEMGYPISERVFRSRMKEPGFPGKPGTPGRRDGDFPVRRIIAWLGGGRLEGKDGANKENATDGPRARLLEAKARKEELELARLEGRVIDRARAEATISRIMAILRTACDAIPDLVTAALPEDQKQRARADVEESLRKALEVVSDVIAEDEANLGAD